MKLDEVIDPTMKLRMELSKLREDQEEARSMIVELAGEVKRLKTTIAALVRKLGPQA